MICSQYLGCSYYELLNQSIEEIYAQCDRVERLSKNNLLLTHSIHKASNMIYLFLTKDGTE